MRREWLAVIAKAPVAGEVKTGLIPTLGAEAASSLYCAFLQDTIVSVRKVVDARPSVRVAFWASGLRADRDVFEDVDLEGFWLMAQLGSTPGDRMQNCADVLFVDRKADSVVMIGADSPTLPSEYVIRSFESLEGGGPERIALGPADDGRCYLIGTNSPQPSLFGDIRWETESACRDTRRAASDNGLEVQLLADWYGVHSLSDLERLRLELILSPESAPRTAGVLAAL